MQLGARLLIVACVGTSASACAGPARTAQTPSVESTSSEADLEQRDDGAGPPPVIVASFDGLGVGFDGPQGAGRSGNPSDNSIAVGPDHIVQVVNSRMAIFTKKGSKYDTTGRVL